MSSSNGHRGRTLWDLLATLPRWAQGALLLVFVLIVVAVVIVRIL